MPIISASIDAFLTAIVITIIPWLYYTLRNAHTTTFGQTTQVNIPQQAHSSRRTYLSIFIALHATFILYNIILCAQPNLFTSLDVPLNEPSDAIRAKLLHLGDVHTLPRALDMLLVRLSSFDVRVSYVRFGHKVIEECEHCTTYYDYALFSLPRPLLEYVREAAVIGLVTIRDSGRERWRKWGLGALIATAALEVYLISTAAVSIAAEGQTTFMWHDALWLTRQCLFLVLPSVLYLLPATRKDTTPLAALPQLTALADQTLLRIQLLKYANGASARSPELREATSTWWARERQEGAWATDDAALRERARQLEMSIDEGGQLRERARLAVEALKGGFKPSDYL